MLIFFLKTMLNNYFAQHQKLFQKTKPLYITERTKPLKR
nr:MAG TPA: hypothetical protein [Caudoviricetes sp.]